MAKVVVICHFNIIEFLQNREIEVTEFTSAIKNHQVRESLKDVFGYTERQEATSYGS